MARTGMSPALRKGPAHKPKRSVDDPRAIWLDAFRRVRAETEKRASHLSAEDQIVQSMADASPTKWHRAHVTWFFEQFLLVPHDSGLPDLRRAISVSFQLVLCRRRSAPCAAAARPDYAPKRFGSRCLSRACRCRGRATDWTGAGRSSGAGLHDRRDRPAARAAAPGIAAHGHSPRICAESDRPGLRRRMAASAPDAGPARLRRRAGRRACGSAMIVTASVSTTKHRFTTSSSRACASPVISSRTPIGWNSSPPEATRRRRFGSPTAGQRCRTKAGRRRAIGGRRTEPGMS